MMSVLIHVAVLLAVSSRVSLGQRRDACSRATDYVLLIDSSSGVSEADWNSTVSFVKEVSSFLRPQYRRNYAALVYFSETTEIVRALDDRDIPQDYARTPAAGRNLSSAFQITRQTVLNNTGDRPDVPDTILLIVHGPLDDRSDLTAENLKQDGIRIVTVGVGANAQMRAQLKKIATSTEDAERLIISRADHFPSVLSPLIAVLCRHLEEGGRGDLRLADSNQTSGRLEMYLQHEWSTICGWGWTDQNARVACLQLGFPGVLSWSMGDQRTNFYPRRVATGDARCTGDETNLLQCSHSSFFFPTDIEDGCTHKQDVFLHCICHDCNDYAPDGSLRMTGGSSVTGRLEAFSVERGWIAVCNDQWTAENTRVACRQLSFDDGAGIYEGSTESVSLSVHSISCQGNESSIFDCNHPRSLAQCRRAVHIQCLCSDCAKILMSEPGVKTVESGTAEETFLWTLSETLTEDDNVYVSLASRKNPQVILRRTGGRVTVENSALSNRVELLGGVNTTSIGFKLKDIQRSDMGIYGLYIPKYHLYNARALLIIKDFAAADIDAVRYHNVSSRITLSWDLTLLRKLIDLHYTVQIATPITGKIALEYFTDNWLRDNGIYAGHSGTLDYLKPKIVIETAKTSDAGLYVVQIDVSSFGVWQRLNLILLFRTTVVILDKPNRPILSHVPSQQSGSRVQLSCTTTSNSAPKNRTPEFEYLWFTDGKRINMTKLDVENYWFTRIKSGVIDITDFANGLSSYSCRVREKGSSFVSEESNNIRLSITTPGSIPPTTKPIANSDYVKHTEYWYIIVIVLLLLIIILVVILVVLEKKGKLQKAKSYCPSLGRDSDCNPNDNSCINEIPLPQSHVSQLQRSITSRIPSTPHYYITDQHQRRQNSVTTTRAEVINIRDMTICRPGRQPADDAPYEDANFAYSNMDGNMNNLDQHEEDDNETCVDGVDQPAGNFADQRDQNTQVHRPGEPLYGEVRRPIPPPTAPRLDRPRQRNS